jgi:outer membrane biosynthesis protein TonB
MPPEYYFGITVAVVLLILLASLIRGRRTARQVLDRSDGTSQLTHQLSRIADSLETLVVRLGASPPLLKQVSAPLQKPSEERAPEPTPIKQVSAPLQKPSEERAPEPTPIKQVSAPLQKPTQERAPEPTPVSEPSPAAVAKSSEPAKPRVVLSMFGR